MFSQWTLEGGEECLLAATGEELHQHQVVGELLLVEQHGRGEADGADEESESELGKRRCWRWLPTEPGGEQVG